MVVNSTAINQERSINYNYIILDYPTHFNKICEKASVPVHLIKVDENNGKWVHVKSHGGLSALREATDNIQHYLTEAELINSLKSEVYPVCISDSPGMGKSTLLQHIGQQLSKSDKRKVLFATMNEFVNLFIQNDVHNENQTVLELTLNKLFSNNVAQNSSLSLKLNSENVQIELLLDGMNEVASSNMSVAFDLLKYLSTIPSIHVWVTTRPHLLHQAEDCLNVLGYNIQAFTKQNQIRFLKDFWLSQNTNLVKDRLKRFAEICLSELNSKLSRKEKEVAGIPLQCRLVAEVLEEQAKEHSDARNPNKTGILQINSLVGLYQRLIEKQYNKYKKHCGEKCLSEEQLNRQHITLAFQLIFPELLEELPPPYKKDINLNELLKVGLLETSSTISKPKFVHRTIGEFLIAKCIVEMFNFRAEKESLASLHYFLDKVFICQEVYVYFNIKNIYYGHKDYAYYFVNDEICYFLDTLLTKPEEVFLSSHITYEKLAQACVYGDYFNLFKAFLSSWKLNKDFSIQKLFNMDLLFLAVKFSALSFLEIISENNPVPLIPFIKAHSLLLSIRLGKLPHVQYLLNVKNLRELVTRPSKSTKLALHNCVKDSAFDSSSIIKQKVNIIHSNL